MHRDDLFTNIHKAIRAGLFDLIVVVGSTDWGEPAEVDRVDHAWRRMYQLLTAHTAHEDRHILRILDAHDPIATESVGAQHPELDRWLGEIDDWVTTIVADPDDARGLALYRELSLFLADYLHHTHVEETEVMARVWERCTDEEIAATRAAFMADTDPAVLDTSLRLMLPAVDAPTRTEMVRRIVGSAPAPVVDHLLSIAADVLPPSEVERLVSLAVESVS